MLHGISCLDRSDSKTETGQTVKQRQIVAKVGLTEYFTGNYLHFESIHNGASVDTMNFYK